MLRKGLELIAIGIGIYYAYDYLQHQYDLARYNELEQLVIKTNNQEIDKARAALANDPTKQIYVDKRTGRGYLNASIM